MATSIRFPVDVRIADREGHGDEHEESRTRVKMETGPARQRRRTRIAVRVFDIQFTLTRARFAIFSDWWQNTIQGGALEFDIQLLNDDDTLVWYTVNWVGEYQRRVARESDDEWIITGKVRSKGEPFTTRPAGTDELRGLSRANTINKGHLVIGKTLRGLSESSSAGFARFAQGPMYGLSTPTMSGRGRLGLRPMLGLSEAEMTGYGVLFVGDGRELRDDGSYELRDDDTFELRG